MWGWAEWSSLFYQKASTDNQLGPARISLYFALLYEAGHTRSIPFYLQRPVVMQKAKIYSSVTLNRCIREMYDYGYIDYRSSFTPERSMVGLVALNNSNV